jgi:hypothetical protein
MVGGEPVRDACPAACEERLDGVHGGANGGRACWVVTGTLCAGETQGTFATKLAICMNCEFFQSVLGEEGRDLVASSELLSMLA